MCLVFQALEASLGEEYNESQMRALMGGLNGQQVVLIQVSCLSGHLRVCLQSLLWMTAKYKESP